MLVGQELTRLNFVIGHELLEVKRRTMLEVLMCLIEVHEVDPGYGCRCCEVKLIVLVNRLVLMMF